MDYKKASNHWKDIDAKSKKMKRKEVLTAVERYINANNTCALATGSGTFIRCTPIEYTYYEGFFWMFSEGGEKFIGLETNENVCVAIYDRYDTFSNLKGMQITGIAKVIEPFSEKYIQLAAIKKIPIQALRKLPEPMNLIQIRPIKIEFLNSDFKKEGYASRQKIEF